MVGMKPGTDYWTLNVLSPACVVLGLLLVAFSYYPFISCLPDQPLVREVKSAMPPETFAQMQACLADHPLTGGAVLGQNAFRKTRGFVIAFNREGIEEFQNDVRFECLRPYFERAALEEANAWVLNLLICHEPSYSSDVVVRSVWSSSSPLIPHHDRFSPITHSHDTSSTFRLHLDDTLKTSWIFNTWLAHQVIRSRNRTRAMSHVIRNGRSIA